MRLRISSSVAIYGLICVCALDQSAGAETRGEAHSKNQFARSLVEQGIPPGQFFRIDDQGVPNLCGKDLPGYATPTATVTEAGKPPPNNPPPAPGGLPSGTRAWECVPGVIRNNGTDTFRLEVDANGPVNGVILRSPGAYFNWVAGPALQFLRDDGLDGDRISGDRIYTSGLLRYNTSFAMHEFLHTETNSPRGLMLTELGFAEVVETNGSTNRFLIKPRMGVLNTNIPMTEMVTLASNVVVSPHLINIIGTNRTTQRCMRYYNNPGDLTRRVYTVLPDAFDFLMLFSMDHVEQTNMNDSANFVAGMNLTPRVSYTGTGLPTISNSIAYGSAWRLQGVNLLDNGGRGVSAGNATHELLHQWSAYTSPSLGMASDTGHYLSHCNMDSLLGGYPWSTNSNGTYTKLCGSAGPTRATALEKYLAGLIPGSAVPSYLIKSNSITCGASFSGLDRVVSIVNIQAVHGIRTPTPATAQKSFSIGFVAESFRRPLTAVELTFYEILAAEYTRDLPVEKPDPIVGFSWVTIERFFGEGTTWSSEVLGLIRPKITQFQRMPNGSAHVHGTGYPGRNYRLLRSTNTFESWSVVTNKVAGTNGTFVLVDSSSSTTASRFYRAATP